MLVYIIKTKKIQIFTLPLEIKGNYWINDIDENKLSRSLVNIQENDKTWVLSCNYDFDLFVNGEMREKINITEDNFYFLKHRSTGEIITIFCTEIYKNYNYFVVNDNSEIIIGKSGNNCQIIYNNNLIGDQQAKLIYRNNKWQITNLNPKCNIYINSFSFNNYNLEHGDVIFIMGLKIIVLGGTIIVNNPAGCVSCSLMPKQIEQINNNDIVEDDSTDMLVYQKKDYFNRSPRFVSKVEKIEMTIDDPPNKIKEDDTSLLITLGPMMTMSMTAIVTIYTGINRAVTEKTGINSVLPTLIMGLAMLATMLVWPLITRKYQDKRRQQQEFKRRDKYELYIQQKRQEIVRYITQQRQILESNYPSLESCSETILNKMPKLWERKIDDEDFLTVRLGLGTVPLDISIKYSTDKFSMEDDILKEIIKNFVEEAKEITGAPITVSFLNKRISGIIGQYELTSEFVKGLLLQLISFYSSDILKIVIITNEENYYNWECFKTLQHLWDNEKIERFYATNNEEAKDVFQYLDKELSIRIEENSEIKNEEDKVIPSPYYFIYTDDYSSISDSNFIKKILKEKTNYGFSLLINDERVSKLPNECSCFINVNKESSGLIENELMTSNQKTFLADFPTNIDIKNCILQLTNIPINIDTKFGGLPDSYGFMELYQIGKVEQLNAANRWKTNNPTISLSAPIGIDENGSTFKIDLHEKYHGPHGLVAGTTGSGKSEWIITFILSMAINYSPNEVSFVLIDYKGGGLALAFENKELGIKLPHIAGTITNLDVNELNRSLASIEAELKRRQREFNKARDISGESTIDIYKYQRLYRDGVVDKPISHLFIISDEFAELKAQQPDFMDQLVSTARIGRSLGVHLILATQKPSGVVNDQIWSNSRFKVCLKVQDKADSNDMIMVPDAASIKQAGRFYLLVGYNDYFAMGQSAYCGMNYIPSEKIIKKVDTFLTFVNNNGYVIKSVDDIKTHENISNNGEVLLNVVKYLTKVAQEENISVNQLWLDRIPNVILVDNLKKKYNYQKEDYIINPIIGEYDNPATQSQHLLTLPLTTVGSTAIYGMAGAGKEDLLATMIYSIITTYTTEEVNLYIIDCGAETLKMFDKAPQVGDVMLSTDQEKIINFFKMLTEIIEDRKKKFVDFGGTLSSYNKLNQNKMATIVAIINGYENFLAYYEPLEDIIIKIGRDSLKYGVIFVFTGSASNAIKMRVKQNFTQNLALQLTDEFDYVNILGNIHKMRPSANKGRGLVKFDEPYEFQSASIAEGSQVLEIVRDLCQELQSKASIKAQPVPILPEEVSIDNVKECITNLTSVPIGIVKSNLEIATFDLLNNYVSIISSNNISNIKNFINGLTSVLLQYGNTKIVILDVPRIIDESLKDKLIYTNNNYDSIVTQINKYVGNINKIYIESNYNPQSLSNIENMVIFLIGLDDIFSRLSLENKNQFINSLNTSKSMNKISYVIVEVPDKIKKYQFDEWYKNNTNSNTGIWVGNGMSDQSLLKSNTFSKELSLQIGNDFGYLLVEGTPSLVKFVKLTEQENVEQLNLGDSNE